MNTIATTVLLQLILTSSSAANYVATETHLRRALFSGYDRMVMPRINGTLAVDIVSTITAITKVDADGSRLASSLTFEMGWNDPRLSWQENSSFSIIDQIEASTSTVWTPKLLFLSDLSQVNTENNPERLLVQKNGTCTFIFVSTATVLCNLGTISFPQDLHECTYDFRLLHGFNVIRLKAGKSSVQDAKGLGEWKIVKVSRAVVKSGDETHYRMLVLFERGIDGIADRILFPLIVSATLVLGTFVVHFKFMERLFYVLLSLFMLLQFHNSPVDDTAIIKNDSLFLTIEIGSHFISWLYLVYSLLTLYVMRKEVQGLPVWLKFILYKCLGRILCVNCHGDVPEKNNKYKERRMRSVDADLYDFKKSNSSTTVEMDIASNGSIENGHNDTKEARLSVSASAMVEEDLTSLAGEILDRLGILLFSFLYVGVALFPSFVRLTT